jgi:hypothetical protein
VPATAIDNMFNAYSLPTKDEGFDHIYDVNENGIVREV